MSIFEYNGAAIVAMAGKDCVAIASDLRFGVQLQTISTSHQKVYKIHDKLMIGLAGLGTDAQTFNQRLQFLHNLYQLREERPIPPKAFSHMVSAELYSRRFGPYFVSPLIAGLSDDGKPFISSMDTIGASTEVNSFEVTGTSPEALYGACEGLWREGLGPEELFETIAQCITAGVDRDCISGWGAVVHVICKDKVITRTLRGRMD